MTLFIIIKQKRPSEKIKEARGLQDDVTLLPAAL
jgi:hypothetical protein